LKGSSTEDSRIGSVRLSRHILFHYRTTPAAGQYPFEQVEPDEEMA
jgi:hypothetical protein